MTVQNRHRIPCPHCSENLRVRKSQGLTPLYREAIFECRNEDCGWRGKASIEITHTIAPSDIPNPTVALPFVPRLRELITKQAHAANG
ncbi:ogr/Delta-like zinc finger family protein [Chromohalobacter canadensis]|uniref:ogr/Delta-like zinc finger family protein n=1 Tax=Chromohalobacter canadensis TaxID=141389 RepID=UPI0021C179CF|nr:ogr/Delta-like zinc finger family protein [Chromohalobacter canadensis]MCT8469426.1 ogr/Delta-like zinc finger family protein [Chromohalobacter canadensis]MCT8472050.1 ogr/Delta-like zinc finger family protein [Chromohalobacter canadensis]MCT8499837.1 ogr/Delta-like zinc finger family protein [Chromohalobacter canadensis]